MATELPTLYRVPAGGLAAWSEPHASVPIAAHLDEGLEVQLTERVGDWGHILCSNGWTAWVDVRLLVSSPGPLGPPQGPAVPPAAAGGYRSGTAALPWWQSRNLRLAVSFVLIVGGIGAALAGRGHANSGGTGTGTGREVFLAPSGTAGTNPFTPSIAPTTPPATVATATTTPAPSPAGVQRADASSPGLYGGTRDVPSCDASRLVSYLEGQPERARAWASAIGIDPTAIRGFVATLTPALLRVDTRITDYQFARGRPQPRQSLLQAGTAVLLDRDLFPRVRCASGDPLALPVATASRYVGPAWPGFAPDTIIVVTPAAPATSIVLIDVRTGIPFLRLAGSTIIIDLDRPAAGITTVVTEPGGRVTVTGSQWPPGTAVQIAFDSPAVVLTAAVANGAGTFAVGVALLTAAAPGVHQITMSGAGLAVTQTVYVIPRGTR